MDGERPACWGVQGEMRGEREEEGQVEVRGFGQGCEMGAEGRGERRRGADRAQETGRRWHGDRTRRCSDRWRGSPRRSPHLEPPPTYRPHHPISRRPAPQQLWAVTVAVLPHHPHPPTHDPPLSHTAAETKSEGAGGGSRRGGGRCVRRACILCLHLVSCRGNWGGAGRSLVCSG